MVIPRRYVPDRGDTIWISFDPQAGHEQAGHRPALVLSPVAYNQATGLAIICHITSHAKGYPFEVVLPAECGVAGIVLSDHVKSVDWIARRATFIGRAPDAVFDDVVSLIGILIG